MQIKYLAIILIFSCNFAPHESSGDLRPQEHTVVTHGNYYNDSLRCYLSVQPLNDSLIISEFNWVGKDTSFTEEPNSHFYLIMKNAKVVASNMGCKAKVSCLFTQKDKVLLASISLDGKYFLKGTPFQKSDLPLKVNDGIDFDPDYFYRLKER